MLSQLHFSYFSKHSVINIQLSQCSQDPPADEVGVLIKSQRILLLIVLYSPLKKRER